MSSPNGTIEPPPHRLARMLAASVAGALLLLALAWVPADRVAGGREPLLAAVAAALLGSLLAAFPTANGLDGPPQRFLSGYFLGLIARFGLTFAAALVVWRLVPDLPRMAFWIWVGAAQGILLGIDTAILLLVCKPTMRASA